ncbi:hypothetical protein Pta02_15030 [Planobispora takensis]|uniref:Uncharacterized protein n=1 Tax=Planobispora takensis TaxID=1367882 RepID=A0A8J3SUC6_9ACTN|nr:hypothetical protein Pta02_15030 [Planobispora takensis]
MVTPQQLLRPLASPISPFRRTWSAHQKVRRGVLVPAALPLLGLEAAARAEARTRARQRLERLQPRPLLVSQIEPPRHR